METSKAGYLMSLAALQRQDPYINKLLDVTGQVALYTFSAQANEWEKTEIEGTLFVYARSASPHHGFTIMNRLSTENLVEPINKDLEFQLQDPFLLYRNANLGIYSIWFYDKKDCQRIARLMVKIVKQEAVQAQSASPERANGVAEPQPIDILELLSKAKEEYGRGQTGEKDVTGPAEQCQNPKELKSAINSTEHAQKKPQPEKSSHTGLKQITVAELFGTSLQKDPSLPAMPTQSANSSDPSKPTTFLQLPTIPTPAPFNPLLPPHLTATNSGASHQCHLPSYALNPSPIGEHQPQCSVSPLLAAPAMTEPHPPAPGTFLGQELLSKLKPPQPSVTPDLHRPMLAPSFLPSALITPQSFGEPIPMTTHAALAAMASSAPVPPQGKEVDVFSQPHNVVKPMPAVPLKAGPGNSGAGFSILLSPSAFQQSFPKATPVPRTSSAAAPPSSPPSYSTAGTEPLHMGPCNKTQLQDTLIHLIKNDPAFLSAIHEAYLQSLCRDLSSLKL